MLSFIVSDADRVQIGAKPLGFIAEAFAIQFNLPNLQVELSLATPDDIRELNLQYRELDEPTDVLSFQLLSGLAEIQALPPEAAALLGSIVICPEKVTAYEESLPQMVEHGLLHLLGLDHESDYTAWQQAERPLLARISQLHIPEVPDHEPI